MWRDNRTPFTQPLYIFTIFFIFSLNLLFLIYEKKILLFLWFMSIFVLVNRMGWNKLYFILNFWQIIRKCVEEFWAVTALKTYQAIFKLLYNLLDNFQPFAHWTFAKHTKSLENVFHWGSFHWNWSTFFIPVH